VESATGAATAVTVDADGWYGDIVVDASSRAVSEIVVWVDGADGIDASADSRATTIVTISAAGLQGDIEVDATAIALAGVSVYAAEADDLALDLDALAEIQIYITAPDMRGDIRVNTDAVAEVSADAWWSGGEGGAAADADLNAATLTYISIDAPNLDGEVFLSSASDVTTDIWLG
jgi:hypothetical protein